MPKVPTRPKTISQIVETQLPDFVRDDYPQFIAFLKAYYEWMEKNGADVYTTKILNSSPITITLQTDASTDKTDYVGMYIVALNGPAKGHTRAIKSYDPTTQTVTLVESWLPGFIPPPNTKMVIRDAMFPNKLLEYRDIDETIDKFINFFRDEFLYQIPGNILADKRNILKHIKQFYQSRGNENSFRFLFRILFDQEIEFYYPKVDLLRTDDARWVVDHIMRISTTGKTFDWINRQIIGDLSGATANVEQVFQSYIDGYLISDLYLSNINGTFGDPSQVNTPENIKIVYPFNPPPQSDLGAQSDLLEPATITKFETAYLLLSLLNINDPGSSYQVGDQINITGGGALAPAQGYVSAIFQTFYTGGAQPPPTTYYLEPYWGPDDVADNDNDPLNDAVAIPGLYFFDDVQSDVTQNDLLNPNQIILAATETNQDDFFVGDVISLTEGTGVGQQRTIISYNGTTKVATVDQNFNPVPDGTTRYSILHNKGGIKAIAITNFGLGFTSTPTVTITSQFGTGGVLDPVLGLVGATAGRWTVGRDGGAGGLPTTPDSFLDSNKVIQDSYYWQDFSYDLRTGQTIDAYRDVVKTLLHPAGMKMFGSVWVKSSPINGKDFLKLLNHYIEIEIDAQVYDTKLKVSTEDIVQLQGEQPYNSASNVVVGSTNADLDGFKFLVFPPSSNFTLFYPFPNQNYWTADGPGNTQISNFADIVIGTIILNPNRRTKIAFDSYINIQSADFTSFVGCVGPNRRTLERGKFFDFPPFEGFGETYPSPNQNYWIGPGNTEIKDVQNVPIDLVIEHPESNRSNLCVDADIIMLRDDSGIPSVGNVVQYAYLEGNDPETVYNVSPNNFTDAYDGVLGNDQTIESVDPTFNSFGINVIASDSQFVNASAVPVFLKQATVIVVAQTLDPSFDQSILNCIQFGSDNGYSIDITAGGGLMFRAQYGGVTRAVSYAPGTLSTNDWFMATLTFDEGQLSGQLNLDAPVKAKFNSYPMAPVSSSLGWFLGKGSVSYTTMANNADLYKTHLFGNTLFGQAAAGSVTTNFNYFQGNYAWTIWYDRAILDFELKAIYTYLKTNLSSQRSITLP